MAVKVHLRKVSIVAERVLREELLELLKTCGATGWTLTSVEGEGSRGIRASEFEGSNVQIDTLVAPEVADTLMAQVADRYFADWSLIVYSADVEVLRGDKYAH
ncbi:MAG: P-II family nitrogen regulator [Chthoniobacterales bacterium]